VHIACGELPVLSNYPRLTIVEVGIVARELILGEGVSVLEAYPTGGAEE